MEALSHGEEIQLNKFGRFPLKHKKDSTDVENEQE